MCLMSAQSGGGWGEGREEERLTLVGSSGEVKKVGAVVACSKGAVAAAAQEPRVAKDHQRRLLLVSALPLQAADGTLSPDGP